ncbi:putative ankyrin repeat protein RF_0381 [Saccostrea echinata]|uniref:putative ankyrin repeat protein RF_0381 n=1 Tax=Saccostrea echinata TaxID=191078 RepID=UPI002A8165B3|nr:putative ankyrin repeat protein RF_0381 [Saccostrea echinata]
MEKNEPHKDGNLRPVGDIRTEKKGPKVPSNNAEKLRVFFSEQSRAEIKDNFEKSEVGIDMFLIACHYGILNICQNVIKYFPDMLNQVDIEGCNAAMHAACGGNIELLELLIKNGVDPKHRSNCGSNILHSACMESDLEMCTHIIQHYPDMLNQVDNAGWNSALYTAKEGSVEVLELLVKNGVDHTLKDIHGCNILHLACCGSKFKICQYIIKHYPDMLSQVDYGGQNAAFYAAKGGNIEILELLKINGVDVKLQSNDGMNILHMACMNAKLEISQYIIEHYPDMLTKMDNEGRNVALYAAKGGNLEILKLLLRNGVDPTLQSNSGINILHMACMNAQLEMCRNIIKHYPDMLNQVSNEGWNAIICAAHGGSTEILELLVKIGLDPMHKVNNGRNILHIACMKSNVAMCRHIINHYPEMLDQVDNNGWNAAICTALEGNVQVLNLLVENGLNPMQKSPGGINILHVACLKSKLEMCKHIIQHYPDMLNEIDNEGRNAAIYAAMGGDVDVLNLLAEHGVRP